ncbi:DCL1_2 [Sanghuangporus vaninii]
MKYKSRVAQQLALFLFHPFAPSAGLVLSSSSFDAMLKSWKQAWKKEDGSTQGGAKVYEDNDTHPGLDYSASLTPPYKRRTSTDAFSTSSSNASPAPMLVRTLSEVELDDVGERPMKRHRTNLSERHASPEAIHSRLPEIMDIDEEEESTLEPESMSIEEFEESLITQTKLENTLAVLHSDSQKVRITGELLEWACGVERERPVTVTRKRRVALVVVEDAATASARAVQLANQCNLSITVYTHSSHASSMESWIDMSNKKEAVIVSARLLFDSLVQGTLAISRVHFMIMDDILSAKDDENHPIQLFMKDFYRATDKLSRPRVFGVIVVSPDPDSQFYFDIRLLELENILDAKYHGVQDAMRDSILSLPDKPMELVIFYDPQVQVAETSLLRTLRSFDPRMLLYRSHYRNSKYALGEIGACACDLVWRRALKEMEGETVRNDPIFEEEDELQAGSEAAIRRAKKNVKSTIRNWLFTMPNLDSTSRGFNVTPKFAKLMQVLKACEPQGDAFRGIIFVQKRSIALVLVDLLRTLDDQIGFIRPQALVGHGLTAEASVQADILEAFRTGVCNLIVATKYAEDLEICPVTIVIRFDLFESQVSYAHCRARARGQQCHLVHMAERGSDVHRRILAQVARIDPRMERWVQRVSTSTGSSVPPLPLRETIDPYRSDSDDEDDDPGSFVQDPTTSGRIYVQDAVTVVYRFTSQLPTAGDAEERLNRPLFEYEELQDGPSSKTMYICTVLLPPGSPLRRVSGSPSSSMSQARRLACYQTCYELYSRGILDYRLFPRPPLPSTRPQRAVYISAKMIEQASDKEEEDDQVFDPTMQHHDKTPGIHLYSRKRPDFWDNTLPIMRGCLYPTIVVPVVNSGSTEFGRMYAPMVILTRLPLPPLSPFDIYFSGSPKKVFFKRGDAFEIDEDRLQDLYKFTVRIVRSITNKPYICALDSVPYFLAPLPRDFEVDLHEPDDGHRWEFPNVVDHIPWDKVQLAASKPTVALNTQDLQTLMIDTEDAMIQDRWAEFTRRYYCVRMRPELTPLSKPEDSPREKEFDNLVEYCKARRKEFTGLQNYKQPLIEVDLCPMLVSHLNPIARPTAESKHAPAKYLIPELCAKCTIPASAFRTACLLPSILSKLDDILLIKELNAKYFDHSIAESQLLAAVSSPSTLADVDYERLELLGDAYLKYLSSIYLFVTFPTLHEGALHLSRQRIISNRSLLKNANRCGLPQYIQSKPFTPKSWVPQNFILYRPPKARQEDEPTEIPEQELEEGELPVDVKSGIGNNPILVVSEEYGLGKPTDDQPETGTQSKKTGKKKQESFTTQWLGDKAVADVAEAIIGAAYVTGGREVALKVTKALNIPVPHIDRWSDFGRKALAPPPEVTAKLPTGSIQAVETIIGHKFNHPHLLAQALTHASISGNEMTSYERLEFIGDAILDFLVIRHIFDRDIALSPGALTLLKGAMVSNAALAAVCIWSGLHEHLLFESASLENNIQAYADELYDKQMAEYEQATREDRQPGQYWVDIEPPKALSDVVESILGAIYVSENFSPVGAEAFFDKVLAPFYDQHITLHTLSHHPTKILFELLQSQGCQSFELVKEPIDPRYNEYGHTVESLIVIHGIILATATDISVNSCARRASEMALDAIEGDPLFMNRHCDCRALSQARKAAKKAEKVV